MFEKEAEENYKLVEEVIYPIFRKIVKNDDSLAEYGVECYLTGYNKANEWHYVKDGVLPKETGKYLVYIINGYGCKFIDLIQYNSSRHFWCVDCQNEVIAWKEIVLPKESE